MEGTISEIRIFAGDFAPKYWAFCQGQTLPINSNQALFSLLGVVYGGNGSTTFMLPDLRGRVPVGAGQGPGLSLYNLGQQTGTAAVTLVSSQMPIHTHGTTLTAITGNGTGSVTLQGSTDGGVSEPAGNFLGQDASGAGFAPYAPPTTGTPVAMASQSLVVNSVTVPAPAVNISNNGGSSPHNNMMPSVAMNYIICIQGLFPSRN